MVLPASVLVPALGAGVGKPGPAAQIYRCVGEQPRLGPFERVDVAAVVRKYRTRGLHVSHARQLQLEIDSVRLALGLQLRDFAT